MLSSNQRPRGYKLLVLSSTKVSIHCFEKSHENLYENIYVWVSIFFCVINSAVLLKISRKYLPTTEENIFITTQFH